MWRFCTLVTSDCKAQLIIQRTNSPLDDDLKPDEVVIKVEAAPINPSDVGPILPFGTNAEALATLRELNKKEIGQGLEYQLNPKFATLPALIQRMPPNGPQSAGNEGAGIVVKTGDSPQAKRLLGKVVSAFGGRMYAQYKKASYKQCIVHNEGTTPAQAASSYINPVTALAMLETMRRENHTAIVHTAAASNLGQMLAKLCSKENVPLVNVVRKQEQEDILLSIGVKKTLIVRSDLPREKFMESLIAAIVETKATLCFDATGGGSLGNDILEAMEAAAKIYIGHTDAISFYGTSVYKQLYIYGGLDRSPTILNRGYGLSWGVAGWLMPNFLKKWPEDVVAKMFKDVADNINTIFKSEYYKQVSLAEMVQKDNFLEFIKLETGKKFLVMPNKNIEQVEFKI